MAVPFGEGGLSLKTDQRDEGLVPAPLSPAEVRALSNSSASLRASGPRLSETSPSERRSLPSEGRSDPRSQRPSLVSTQI